MNHNYESSISLKFAGQSINCLLNYAETQKYFRKYIDKAGNCTGKCVKVSQQAFEDWSDAGNHIDSFAEFCLLCQPISESLMEHNACIFHGAALRFRGKAIIIAGGSGVGKSTHCQKLIKNHPDEFSVINGDKPLLSELDNKHHIIVNPSPWNGKEGMHGAEASLLSAIYILRRNNDNSIIKCKDSEAAVFTFPLIFQSFDNMNIIRNAGVIAEKIVKNTFCYTFNSCDIDISSEILYRSIKETVGNDI